MAIFAVNLIVFITMVVEVVFFMKVMSELYASCAYPYNTPDCNISGFISYMTQLGYVSGTYYTILTISLVVT